MAVYKCVKNMDHIIKLEDLGTEKVYIKKRTSNTATVIETERVDVVSSGTAAAGLGHRIRRFIENAAGTLREAFRQEVIITTATDAAEESKVDFHVLRAGTLTKVATLDSSGLNNTVGSATLADVVTTGTAEETLATYSLPANTLNAAGRGVRIRAWGTTAGNGNNKTQKLKFGGSTLISTGALAANAKKWFLEAVVHKVSSNVQRFSASGLANGAVVQTDNGALAITDTAAIAIIMTATDATAAADTTLSGFTVELI